MPRVWNGVMRENSNVDDGRESYLGKFLGQMPSSCVWFVAGDTLKRL